MSDTYFEILRSGINSSIQDKGRNHLYHIGITISGAKRRGANKYHRFAKAPRKRSIFVSWDFLEDIIQGLS